MVVVPLLPDELLLQFARTRSRISASTSSNMFNSDANYTLTHSVLFRIIHQLFVLLQNGKWNVCQMWSDIFK